MNFMNRVRVGKEIGNILLSKHASIYSEYLNRFIENPNFLEEFKQIKTDLSTSESIWLKLYEGIVLKQFRSLPVLIHKYIACRARDEYIEINKISTRFNIPIRDIARHYRKLCNKVIQNSQPKATDTLMRMASFFKMNSVVGGRRFTRKKDPYLTLIKGRLSKKLTVTPTNAVQNVANPFNAQSKDEEEEETEKERAECHLDLIKRKNKLNIYVGEYETYTCKNPNIEKIKIYEGKLCSTYFLNANTKKKNHEKSTLDKIDVRKIIKKEGGIFIPSDVNKQRFKEYSNNRILARSANCRTVQNDLKNTVFKQLQNKDATCDGRTLNTLGNTIILNTSCNLPELSKYGNLLTILPRQLSIQRNKSTSTTIFKPNATPRTIKDVLKTEVSYEPTSPLIIPTLQITKNKRVKPNSINPKKISIGEFCSNESEQKFKNYSNRNNIKIKNKRTINTLSRGIDFFNKKDLYFDE